MSLTIKQLTDLVMKQAKVKGFGTRLKEINVAEKIALIHSELSEAYEAYRHKKQNKFEEELTDVIQRVFHLAGIMDVDIEKVILKKLNSNKNREWKWNKMNENHR
jgi:NTP pyrophosphatase (non-canonical NTP hydrolase)